MCEAGAWGATWNLDGEWRTLGNKRKVDNQWYKTDDYYSAITVKTAGTYLLSLRSTIFPSRQSQVEWLVSRNGEGDRIISAVTMTHTFQMTNAYAIQLNAGDKVDVKTRVYGAAQNNGWDQIRLVKLS